jgi:hypothetical protein
LDGLHCQIYLSDKAGRCNNNDEEARQLSGEYSLVKAAKIQAMGPKCCD